jgi:hypothetical protein
MEVGGEGEAMAKHEAALPMSCYIVPYLPTITMLHPQPVSHTSYTNARRRLIWLCSFTFPRSFQCVKGINVCFELLTYDGKPCSYHTHTHILNIHGYKTNRYNDFDDDSTNGGIAI